MEPTDTQKQIIQHIHKLLEKPEDWTPIPSHTGNFTRIEHASKLSISWPTIPGSSQILLRTPHLDEAITLEDANLKTTASVLRQTLVDSTTLAFLESLPQ